MVLKNTIKNQWLITLGYYYFFIIISFIYLFYYGYLNMVWFFCCIVFYWWYNSESHKAGFRCYSNTVLKNTEYHNEEYLKKIK